MKVPDPNGAILTVAPGLAFTKSRNASPLLRTTKNEGMAVPVASIVKRFSPPAELFSVSSLESLLNTMAALAPACATLLILDANVQFPRSINAIFPVSDPAKIASHARPSGSAST